MRRSLGGLLLLLASISGSPVLADEAKPIADEAIRATVDGHVADLKACMKDQGAATGKLVVEFWIQPDGHVSEAKVGHGSSNHKLDQCIAEGFRRWTFPKPRGGRAWLSAYPIVFSAPKEPPKGTLTDDEIVKTVQGKMAEVQACLGEAVKEKADVTGVAELGIVVSPAGKVIEVSILKSSTQAPKLDACIVAKVKTWPFPKPHGNGEAAFRYPFKFNVK